MLIADIHREGLEAQLQTNPVYRNLMYDTLQAFPAETAYLGFDDIKLRFLDVCYQSPGRAKNPAEMMIAATLWQMIAAQKLVWHPIIISSPPFADREIDKNQAVLDEMVGASQVIDGLFVDAEFVGGNQGPDGYICTSTPIPFGRKEASFIEKNSGIHAEHESTLTSYPLEVGYITPSRIMGYLLEQGVVARWPYGAPYIIFFERVNHHELFMKSLDFSK